jgi:methionine sulfoxide reductase heme-binding subunit
MRLPVTRSGAARVAVFLLCLTPFLKLVWDGLRDDLTANPIEDLTHRTGWWTLTLLMVTLTVTPVRRLTGWNRLVQYRRMIGLFAFFYACLHVAIYFGLDQLLSFDYILEDIAERPYITVGFTAWVLLIPLAITSTKGWIRRLGKRWQRLHRLIYVSAALGVLHFLWLVKADVREPLIYALILAVLMALRLPFFKRRRGQRLRPVAKEADGYRASKGIHRERREGHEVTAAKTPPA